MKKEEQVAFDFWSQRKDYPSYPNTLRRRLIDTNYITKYAYDKKSIADIGCGDGSMLLSLREFTTIESFYGYDLSNTLIDSLKIKWGGFPGLEAKVANLIEEDYLPEVDITLSLGSFPYIFQEEKLHKLLSIVNSKLLIVRAPCTLKEEDETINKFSEDLGEEYAAVYRKPDTYESILSEHFTVKEVVRAYPDDIESKYGTKHYFFTCSEK